MELERSRWLAQAGNGCASCGLCSRLFCAGEMLAALDVVEQAAKATRRAGGVMLQGAEWVAVGDKPQTLEDRLREACTRRERGNHLFKSGDMEGAISEYSAGLEAYPDCAPLRCNRGSVYMKLGEARLQAALEDLEAAVALDSMYTKAIQRRDELKQRLQ